MNKVVNIMADSRAVDKKFVNDFLDKNNLGKILEYVKDEQKKLILCFRGNSGQTITIYKKNHVFWEINKLSRGNFKYRLRFNFNHARYSKGWETALKDLKDLKWEQVSNLGDENKINIGYLKYDFNVIDDNFLEKSYQIINKLIDDYFDPNKKFDYFSKRAKKNKSINLEKQRQQELYEKYNKPIFGEGYLIYDLEFVEKENRNGNKPDFWAIKYEKGVPKKLVIGEVKSKESALSGKSGILEHLKAMVAYSNGESMGNRREEAIEILKSYAALELKGFTKDDLVALDNIVLSTDVEVLVVLTDEAAEVYDQAWEQAVLGIDSNIKIIKFSSDELFELDKSGFDNIILKNLIGILGENNFGFKVKDGRIYRNYYNNDKFNNFVTEMCSSEYKRHYDKFNRGLGKELLEKENSNGKFIPPKMAHVASSSRFCYLALRNGTEAIGGSGDVEFEKGCAIKGVSGFPPQLDAFVANENIYIEAKCHEIFDDKVMQMSISYWDYLFEKDKELGFNLPVGDEQKADEFYIPFEKFGFINGCNRFDFKQFLCHLLGIASRGGSATLVYLFFKPKNERYQESINKVFDELKDEIKVAFNSEYIQAFCNRNQITLKAVAEYSEVMEPLTQDNLEVLF